MSYAIRNDGFNYQGFYLDPYSITDLFPNEFDIDDVIQFYAKDIEMKPYWRGVQAEFNPIEGLPVGTIPDVCTWLGSSLVFSPKAYDSLFNHLNYFGEFLPLSVNGETFYLFNCLTHGQLNDVYTRAEKLDESGEVLQEERIRFNDIDTNDKLLFKTMLNNCSVLFCNEKFKDLYKSKNLTGITFDELN